MMEGGFWSAGMFLGAFVWLLFIGLVLFLVFYLLGKLFHTDSPKDKSSIAILNERYAKGEINRQEYEEKKQVLTRK
ncbi:putative membrane protein [Alkalicoccus daliensis]|uniref:Putative membrane protein n=2 Tax=Alkalicoccus daliensis TaxID=745820 RepID=A0A1G9ZB46_9BACI|nr:putative membrane protein [Alkalicoccus daliensis]